MSDQELRETIIRIMVEEEWLEREDYSDEPTFKLIDRLISLLSSERQRMREEIEKMLELIRDENRDNKGMVANAGIEGLIDGYEEYVLTAPQEPQKE